MSIEKLEKDYLNDEVSKPDFISRMYKENHDKLFEYAEFIKSRDIQKIEITDDSVIMTSRELGIKIVCNRFDERIAPIEILNFRNYENDSIKKTLCSKTIICNAICFDTFFYELRLK